MRKKQRSHNEPRNKNHTPQSAQDKKRPQIILPQNSTLAWGRHAITAALTNPNRKIIKIYTTPDMAQYAEQALQHKKDTDLEVIDKNDLNNAIAKHLPAEEKAVHQGLVAVMRPLKPPPLEDWLEAIGQERPPERPPERIMVILLDQITDARNIGAIMRSARAFKAHALITTERHCPPETGTMLRAASGAAEHIPLIKVVNLSRTIEKLQHHGFMVAGMTASGNTPLTSMTEHDRLAIVMGAEGKGLRRMTQEHADLLVRIPIDEETDSLNVASATAVALYAASLGHEQT